MMVCATCFGWLAGYHAYHDGLLRLEMSRAATGRVSPGALDIFSSRLAAVATTATELDSVARVRFVLSRVDDALPFAERALHVEPDCWRCQDTYALLLSAKGRNDEATAVEARALELLPERSWDAPVLFARLRKYQAAARATTAPAPAVVPPTKAPTDP